MDQIFELENLFDPYAGHAIVAGDVVVTILPAESQVAGHIVVAAPAEIGAIYGWRRRSDLEAARQAYYEALGEQHLQEIAEAEAYAALSPEERAERDQAAAEADAERVAAEADAAEARKKADAARAKADAAQRRKKK